MEKSDTESTSSITTLQNYIDNTAAAMQFQNTDFDRDISYSKESYSNRSSDFDYTNKKGIGELEDKLFRLFINSDINRRFSVQADNDNCKIELEKFLSALEDQGIFVNSDERLVECKKVIDEISENYVKLNRLPVKICKEEFHEILQGALSLIHQTITASLIIPDFRSFRNTIEKIFLEVQNDSELNKLGKNEDYIPQLDEIDQDIWAVSICTIDGQRLDLGNFQEKFTLQGMVKTFTYAAALSEYGVDHVHKFIGTAGTTTNDSSILKTSCEIKLNSDKKPHNPMCALGAILNVSLIKPELTLNKRFDFIHNIISSAAGNEFTSYNNSAFLSLREWADRDNSLAYFLKENKCYPKNVERTKGKVFESLELLFQSRCLELNTKSAAVAAATLANSGICPTTSKQVFKPEIVKNVLSMLLSSGLCGLSGQFAFDVGLPGKSGNSGCLLIVVPNVCGICCYSPKLNEEGVSVKGVSFAKKLVENYSFHQFDDLTERTNNDNSNYNNNFRTRSGQPSGSGTKSKHKTQKKIKKSNPRRTFQEISIDDDLSALLYAAHEGDLMEIMRFNLKNFDFEMTDYDARTPLHIAASEGHYNVVEYLLKYVDVSPDEVDRWGRTPYDNALQFGHKGVCRLIENYIRKYSYKSVVFSGASTGSSTVLDD